MLDENINFIVLVSSTLFQNQAFWFEESIPGSRHHEPQAEQRRHSAPYAPRTWHLRLQDQVLHSGSGTRLGHTGITLWSGLDHQGIILGSYWDHPCILFMSKCTLNLEADTAIANLTVHFCRYESGDHVAVYPINEASIVNKIGEILGVDLDTVISLKNLDGRSWLMSFFLVLVMPQRPKVLWLTLVVSPGNSQSK